MARAPVVRETEAPPEADRLDGVLHPRETRVLFGHADAERTLAQSLASGRLHHAWLITGSEGIGKATLAYRFARHALAKPSERDPAASSLKVAPEITAARQVLALSHPGLLVIRRPWDAKTKRHTASIPVDEVRRIKSFLGHTADVGQYRVVIVDSADELNINAANALLKSLEEPPTATVFLLVASEPGRLLPTIRSRCRTLELKPLADTDLRRAVQEAFKSMDGDPPTTSDWTRLSAMAEGSVRRLLALWLGNGLELSERVDRLLGTLPQLDWNAIHALGDELGSMAAAERFETFFDLLLLRLARLVSAAARGSTTSPDAEMAMRLIGEARLATWAELWETIVREKSVVLALNLDRKSLILDTFSRIEQAARAEPAAPLGLGV